ncbi:MAG: bifunctional aspartate kinase/homoserine dehydrogenase I, partial [Bacteroidales bacterium]|nr:bifunctional aspartate kinase/homoserine dehydrogenase I [Bacteroidales bacterium]
MQVLKFGGSSVANAANMSKVVDIVRKALKEDKTLVVASAISGATDRLIEIGRLAEVANPKWETLVNELESRHYQIIDELLPHDFAVSAKETIGKLFAELKS